MASNATDDRCASGDNLCVVRVYEQEVIIVPVLLLLASAATLLAVCLLRWRPPRRGPAPKRDPPQPSLRRSRRPDRGRDLRGIDGECPPLIGCYRGGRRARQKTPAPNPTSRRAPKELNIMEHEVIQMPLHPVQQAPPLHPLQEAPPLHPLQEATPLHPLQEATPLRPVQQALPRRPSAHVYTVM
ncbi:unnamed protein product [Boreogadus saida]